MVLRDDSEKRLLDAMAMEKEYRKLQTDWEAKTAFGYHEKLQAFGFADTVEYELAKAEHYISNTTPVVKYVNQSTVMPEIFKAIEDNIVTVLIVTPDVEVAYIGNDTIIDVDYCKRKRIPVVTIDRGGGVIVSNPADIAFVYVTKYTGLLPVFVDKAINYLKQLTPDVKKDKNDILVNGYKVSAAGMVAEYACVIHFSLVVDIEKITAISKKEMVKKPKGLSELANVTKQNIIDEALSWLP